MSFQPKAPGPREPILLQILLVVSFLIAVTLIATFLFMVLFSIEADAVKWWNS